MTTTIALILGIGLALAAMITGLCLDVEKVIRNDAQRRADNASREQDIAEIRGELALAKRSMQAMAARILALFDDTGPIQMDRPSPAQLASPTRPDLSRQRPTPQPRQQPEPVHTGATATTGPRHAKPKRRAS